MSDNELKIYEEHIRKEELYQIRFELMGMMLDSMMIGSIIDKWKWKSVYIYGGGYLGIQAYHAFSPYIQILGMVDRSGGIVIPIDEARVYSLEEFIEENDSKSPVIITPLESAKMIYQDLAAYIDEERIYYINELF